MARLLITQTAFTAFCGRGIPACPDHNSIPMTQSGPRSGPAWIATGMSLPQTRHAKGRSVARLWEGRLAPIFDGLDRGGDLRQAQGWQPSLRKAKSDH
jgi:hypothetical protein